MGDSELDEMRRAVENAQRKPEEVRRSAKRVLGSNDASRVPEVVATAHWAAGLAAREFNELTSADSALGTAVAIADGAGLVELAARIRISHALVFGYLGKSVEALQLLALAEPLLRGSDLARVLMQRGLLYQRSGRHLEAIEVYAFALPLLEEDGDLVGEIRLRSNRSVAEVYVGDFDAAEADLHSARTAAGSIDQTLQVASCSHNLAFVNGRRGDLAASLTWFEQAWQEYADLGVDHGSAAVLLIDRAEVLANVGMVTEAMSDAAEARSRLAATDNVVELAETELLLARIALMAGDRALAHEVAKSAETAFAAQDRRPWEVLASAIAFRSRDEVASTTAAARFLHGPSAMPDTTQLAEQSSAIAQNLTDAGWDADARIVATIGGQLWRAAGDDERAAEALTPVATVRTRGSALQRVQGWQAEALLRIIGGNRPGARRAIRAGLDTIAAYRATMAATDLRATVSSIGDRLSTWLVELALDGGRPRDVLGAAEAWRAGALVAPVAAPEDPELERLLAELRSADADRRAGIPGADARRARLETAVRDRSRQLPGTAAGVAARFDVDAIADALGDRVLVEFVENHRVLHAVTLWKGRARLHELGPLDAIVPEIRSIRSCLHRLARASGSARSLASAREALAHASATVDEALFGSLPAVGDAPTVVVPTGLLHGVPWSALPRLRDTPFSVAPSATAWLAATRRTSETGRAVLAAGPDLDGAVTEVEAIAAAHPDATVLTGDDAIVEAVLGALDGAAVAHFASHGDFRLDNPQLCSLRLADGDLRVYDLERLRSIPPVVVLSACDAGAVAVKAGDELLGFSAAVLRLGAASLVAPVVPVDDAAAVPFVIALHRHLAEGRCPAEALQLARSATVDDGSPRGAKALAVAASFLVVGS